RLRIVQGRCRIEGGRIGAPVRGRAHQGAHQRSDGDLLMDNLATPAELREIARVWEQGAYEIEQDFVPTRPEYQRYADRDRRVARALRFVADKLEATNG